MRPLLLVFFAFFMLSACSSRYIPPPPPPQKTYLGPDYSSKESFAAKNYVEAVPTSNESYFSIDQQKAMLKEVFNRIQERGKSICTEVNALHDSCKWLILHVKKSDIPNIYPWGNRNININEGILSFIENEDEMAFVLSHEMGHLLARHVEKQAERERASEPVKLNFDFMACNFARKRCKNHDNAGLEMKPLSALMHEGSTVDFNKKEEREANYIATYLIIQAGYDISGIRSFLVRNSKLISAKDANDKSEATYFDTHDFEIENLAYIDATYSEIVKTKKTGQLIIPVGQ